MEKYHGTTILGVKKGNRTVIAGDGQVSLGNTVIKPNAKKVRRLGEEGKVIGGFAGATADAFTLFEKIGVAVRQNRKIDDALRTKILVDNPARLYGFSP